MFAMETSKECIHKSPLGWFRPKMRKPEDARSNATIAAKRQRAKCNRKKYDPKILHDLSLSRKYRATTEEALPRGKRNEVDKRGDDDHDVGDDRHSLEEYIQCPAAHNNRIAGLQERIL